MKIDTHLNISLDKFLYDVVNKYHLSKKIEPLIPEARNILFDSNANIIIGTYEHLRTPFSSRLITGDARFSAIANSINIRCISFLLDMTMAPIDRYHKTARGDRTGLYVFSNKLSYLDHVISKPKQYISYKNTINNFNIGWREIKNHFHDPIISFLIEHHKYSKQKALFVAGEMSNRAHQIVEIYKSTANENHLCVSDYLLSVRNKFWETLKIDEYTTRIEKLSVSTLNIKIAHTLLLFKDRPWFQRFLKNASIYKLPLMKYLSEDGYNLGLIYCDNKCEDFKILHPVTKKFICKIYGWDQLCETVAKRQSFPTTIILYFLFHIIAGYPHFGDSYDMNNLLCKILDISVKKNIDLTHDYTNSIPINEITIPMGVSKSVQKNITVDVLWYGFSHYKNICDNVIKSGKLTGKYTFGNDLPVI